MIDGGSKEQDPPYFLPMNFVNSANGTAPRPWIGAMVATFNFNFCTSS